MGAKARRPWCIAPASLQSYAGTAMEGGWGGGGGGGGGGGSTRMM